MSEGAAVLGGPTLQLGFDRALIDSSGSIITRANVCFERIS